MEPQLERLIRVSFNEEELSFLMEQPAFRAAMAQTQQLTEEEGLDLLCRVGTALIEKEYGPWYPLNRYNPGSDRAES